MDNKPVILITGTRKGIGRYLAQYYVEKGYSVLGCSRGPCDYALPNYRHFCVDVTDEKETKELFSEIRKTYDCLDVLINNAGMASMNHALVTPLSTVREILNTNLVGTFLFCREAAKQMQKRRYGRIVNLTTVAVPLKLAGEAIYAASKAGVETLTMILARELGGLGITVNAVGPVPIETDLIRGVPKEKIDRLLSLQAIPRLGTMEDVANIVDFFIKKESGMVTGQILYLGGV